MHRYVIALGGNRCHGQWGHPIVVLRAALASLPRYGVTVEHAAPIITTAPIGPSRRRFANGAALVHSVHAPAAMLAALKQMERSFGRCPGVRWGARVLDLDIILWSGGRFASRRLSIPHRAWQGRSFVARPVAAIAGDWPVPRTPGKVRHVAARLGKARPTGDR